MEPIGICPFCGEECVDMEHVSTCSMNSVKTRKLDNEFQFGPPEKLERIVAFTKKYTEATALEKEQLWVCRSCYDFGRAETTLAVCPCCGTASTASASEFMEKLGK
jgi:ABC-type ATPase with predicted acetyltransferase domain